MSGIPLNPTESFRKLNPHLYGGAPEVFKGALKSTGGINNTIKQDSKPLLNKLERQAFEQLKSLFPKIQLRPQAKRFKLANGLWYKPDFTALVDGQETAWEVKGPFAYPGALAKLKMAATAWPEVRWILMRKDQNGSWENRIVLS